MLSKPFADREDAGRQLAAALAKLNLTDPLIMALPRGGVPVAAVVADRLQAPLDLLLVRKLGAPGEPEFAIGAVVDGKTPSVVLHDDTIDRMAIPDFYVRGQIAKQLASIAKRRRRYLGDTESTSLHGRQVVIVDDGIATGATVEAALKAVGQAAAGRVILAVPVAPAATIDRLRAKADEIVCLAMPRRFGAVGAHYREFDQVSDDEVVRLLTEARSRRGGLPCATDPGDGDDATGNDKSHTR